MGVDFVRQLGFVVYVAKHEPGRRSGEKWKD